MRSGFATLVGRPNVGKSTLLNAILGMKVSITAKAPQTTRTEVRGVLNRDDVQVVFVDTPGIHKPRSTMGERLNATATGALDGVDVSCLVLDATAPVGRGDTFVASRLPPDAICVLNKVDAATREETLAQLTRAGAFEFSAYYPVSARTGEGVPELVDAIVARLPEGPQYYPDDMVTDVGDAFWVAELVREQLLVVARDELPHSIACRGHRVGVAPDPLRDPRRAGVAEGDRHRPWRTRAQAGRPSRPPAAEPGAYLELVVKVDKDWQRRPKALDRLGY